MNDETPTAEELAAAHPELAPKASFSEQVFYVAGYVFLLVLALSMTALCVAGAIAVVRAVFE